MASDERVFSDAFINLTEAVAGTAFFDMLSDAQVMQASNALDAILKHYRIKDAPEVRESGLTFEERLSRICKPLGIMRRNVKLEKGWYRDAFGAYLGKLDDGSVVALLPTPSGYRYVDNTTGESVKVNTRNASRIAEDAVCLYMPLPQEKLSTKKFVGFIFRNLQVSDYIKIALATLLVTLVSMITPAVTNLLYSQVVFQPSIVPLLAAFVLLATSSIASLGIGAVKSLTLARIKTRVDVGITSAITMRIYSLPPRFFRNYTSGDLVSRANQANSLASTIIDLLLSDVLSVVMGLAYVVQIFGFAATLAVPALLVLLVQVGFSVITVIAASNIGIKRLKTGAEEQGFLYAMMSGIQKIRLSGSERRAFAGWAEKYKATAMLTYRPPLIVKYAAPLSTLISLAGMLLIYVVGYASGVDSAAWMAFSASYGLLSGSFTSLTSASSKIGNVKSQVEMVKPILEAEPEVYANRSVVSHLNGSIKVDNVSFRYDAGAPLVIDDLSLEIEPGSYVAVVGKSGCGKSTLLRLLMGFETPQKGGIYFDEQSINRYDLQSLRKHMGIVMQNAQLFPGSIADNVRISAPGATDDEVWEALEMAGVAEDVRRMPMGLRTIVAENAGGVSGGQKQRIVIARAIIAKPDILFFDEATSALDNITQRIVSDSLDTLNCTRVVIAHRLSTVRNCDRIVMLEGGHIIEDGSYDELIAADGKFAELVRNQQV